MGYRNQHLDAAWCDYRDAANDYSTLPHNAPLYQRERLRRRVDKAIERVREIEADIAREEQRRKAPGQSGK